MKGALLVVTCLNVLYAASAFASPTIQLVCDGVQQEQDVLAELPSESIYVTVDAPSSTVEVNGQPYRAEVEIDPTHIQAIEPPKSLENDAKLGKIGFASILYINRVSGEYAHATGLGRPNGAFLSPEEYRDYQTRHGYLFQTIFKGTCRPGKPLF